MTSVPIFGHMMFGDRRSRAFDAELTSSLATTQAINCSRNASGGIVLPAGIKASGVAFYGAATEEGVYGAIVDRHGSAITIGTYADSPAVYVPIPEECVGAAFVKIVLQGYVTEESMTAEVCLKS